MSNTTPNPGRPTGDGFRASLLHILDGLADITGDGTFRRAAAALRGHRPGRRSVDDTQALTLVRSLLADGSYPSRYAACRYVAELISAPQYMHATAARLMRKSRT